MAKDQAQGDNHPLGPDYWDDLFHKEFQKESDRAAVVLSATFFDSALETLIRSFLVPCSGSNDELFDGSNAPLGNFSSRIVLALRLGLISSKFARDLNLIRKIRNDFAHDIHGCDFENARVKSRVQELMKSCDFMSRHPHIRDNPTFPKGTRGDFLMVASWMLYSLNGKLAKIKCLTESSLEWGYTVTFSEKETDEK